MIRAAIYKEVLVSFAPRNIPLFVEEKVNRKKENAEIFAYITADGSISFVAPAKVKICFGTKNKTKKNKMARPKEILKPAFAILSAFLKSFAPRALEIKEVKEEDIPIAIKILKKE